MDYLKYISFILLILMFFFDVLCIKFGCIVIFSLLRDCYVWINLYSYCCISSFVSCKYVVDSM